MGKRGGEALLPIGGGKAKQIAPPAGLHRIADRIDRRLGQILIRNGLLTAGSLGNSSVETSSARASIPSVASVSRQNRRICAHSHERLDVKRKCLQSANQFDGPFATVFSIDNRLGDDRDKFPAHFRLFESASAASDIRSSDRSIHACGSTRLPSISWVAMTWRIKRASSPSP